MMALALQVVFTAVIDFLFLSACASKNFLRKMEQIFMCVCCQELAFQPITTICSHNVCKVRPLSTAPRRGGLGRALTSPPSPSSP